MLLAALLVLGWWASVRADPELYRSMTVTVPRQDNVEYRLKPHWKPTHYKVSLIPFIPENLTFAGRVEITFTALLDRNTICLHKDLINVDETSLEVKEVETGRARNNVVDDRKGKKNIAVVKTWEDKQRHFYFIQIDQKFHTNLTYVVSMDYNGTLQKDLHGFYRTYYNTTDGEKRWLATTAFESTNARSAFPCFDEPALKARFIIRISRLGNMTSISNMPQDGKPVKHMDTPDGVGRFWDTFQETPLMSTYLVAFVVSDFDHLSDASASVRIFAQPSMVEQGRYALQVSPLIMSWLEEFTGIKYALPKMDGIAVPELDAAAMENWGLVTYSADEWLLVKEGVTTSRVKQQIGCVIAHEFTHQWFGNLVTPEWWSFLWLKEGFATYFEYFATTQVEKSWRLEEQFIVEVQAAMSQDDTTKTRAMTHHVESRLAISSLYDSISYSKAASVIRMTEHIITTETFKKGLRNYLKDRSYSTATPDILFSHLSKQFKADDSQQAETVQLTDVLKAWTEQKGYPVIQVTRDYNKATAKINQTQFLTRIYTYTVYNPKWFVPLTFTSEAEPDFTSTTTKLWLRPKDKELVIPGLSAKPNHWLIFNVQVTGFYRVNYDDKNWEMLSAFLNSDKFETITAVNRAQLIDDSFSLARAGLRSYCLPLGLIRYLKRETDYIPWVSAIKWMKFMHGRLRKYTAYAPLKKWFVELTLPVYESVGLEENDSDSHVTRVQRKEIVEWMCSLGHLNCTTKATRIFEQYRNEPPRSLQRTMFTWVNAYAKSSFYHSALKNGSEAEWNFLWEQYLKAETSSQRAMILSVLGSSKNVSILNRYLEMAISKDSTILRKDRPKVYWSVLNGGNEEIALDFFIRSYKKMDPKVWIFDNILSRTADRLKRRRQIVKLEGMLGDVSSDPDKRKAVQAAIRNVDANIEWVRTSGSLIVAWARDELAGVAGSKRDCRIMEDPRSELELYARSPGHSKSSANRHVAELLLFAAVWVSRCV